MGIQIYVLDASGNLRAQRDLLRKYARLAVRKVQRKIALDNVDIVIRESERPELFKDIDGIGGYCPNGHFVQVSIDINHPSIRTSLKQTIESTIIHELHHAARIQSGIIMNKGTFLEYLFSEGLADYFAYGLTGVIPKWIIPLNKEDRIRLLDMVKNRSRDNFTDKDHRDWFVIGSEEQRIPQFAGYTIGFEIVRNYLTDNPDQSAASLVGTPVEEISYLFVSDSV